MRYDRAAESFQLPEAKVKALVDLREDEEIWEALTDIIAREITQPALRALETASRKGIWHEAAFASGIRAGMQTLWSYIDQIVKEVYNDGEKDGE